MKLNLNLLKIVPLVTVATGIIVPIEMANAAGDPTAIKNAHPIEQKAAPPVPQGNSYSEAAPPAPQGNSYSEAAPPAPYGDGHSEAATPAPHGDDHSEAATPAPHGDNSVTKMLLSPKAQQIEFFAFLGAIGLAIVIPELRYRPKKIVQNFLQLEDSVREFPQEVSSKSQDIQSDKSEQNTPQAEADAPQFQLVEFSKETPGVIEEPTASISKETTVVEIAEEPNTSIDRDLTDRKIIPDDIEPYTIPYREQSQFDISGQIEIDNWSQPGRKAA